jgi:hypothetical protein
MLAIDAFVILVIVIVLGLAVYGAIRFFSHEPLLAPSRLQEATAELLYEKALSGKQVDWEKYEALGVDTKAVRDLLANPVAQGQ